jgi:hypothetical protein
MMATLLSCITTNCPYQSTDADVGVTIGLIFYYKHMWSGMLDLVSVSSNVTYDKETVKIVWENVLVYSKWEGLNFREITLDYNM